MERNTNTLYILRFLAAILVVLYHYSAAAGVFGNLSFLLVNGSECVNFFFFISGFVMIIANIKYFDNENNDFSKFNFYIKRIARIYPLYVFAILALAFFHYNIHSIDTPSVKYRLPFELLGIQRWLYWGSFNYPGWSISCEFFFYLFFPFIIIYMRKNLARFKVLVIVYFVVSILINIVLDHYSANQNLTSLEKRAIGTLQFHPMFLISIFLFGILCGKLYIEDKNTFFKNRWNNRAAVLVSVAAIFFIKYYIKNPLLLTAGILSPIYFVFITSITSFKKKHTSVFSSSFFIFLGEISYGIYILQYPVNIFFTYYITKVSNVQTLLFFVFILIIFASITHYLIEIPAKNLVLKLHNNRKISNKPNQKTPVF